MKKLIWIGLGTIALAGGLAAYVQAQAPSELAGCVYNATPPTLSDKQTVVIQCNVNGKIITH